MSVSEQREEREWQMATSRLTTAGLFWALVKVLIAKRVLTIDDLKDQVIADAGATSWPPN